MAEAPLHLEVVDPVFVPLLMVDWEQYLEFKEAEGEPQPVAEEDEPSVVTCFEKLSIQELAESRPSEEKDEILAGIKLSVPVLPTLPDHMNAIYAKATEKVAKESPKTADDPNYCRWINAKYAELSFLPREKPPSRPTWAKTTSYTVPITDYQTSIKPCQDALEKFETMCVEVEKRFIDKVFGANTDQEEEIHRLTNSENFDLWVEAKTLQDLLNSYYFEGKRLFIDFHSVLINVPRGLRCNYIRRLDTCMSLLRQLRELNRDKRERLRELTRSADPAMSPSLGFAASKSSTRVRNVVPKMPASISDAARKRIPRFNSASRGTARLSRSADPTPSSSLSSAVAGTSLPHCLSAAKTSTAFTFTTSKPPTVFRFTAPETSPAFVFTAPNASTAPNMATAFRFTAPDSSPAFRFTAPDSSPAFRFTASDSSPAFRFTAPDSSPSFKFTPPRVSEALECASAERSTETCIFTSNISPCSDGAPTSSVEATTFSAEEHDSSNSDEINIGQGARVMEKRPLGIPAFDARWIGCILNSVSRDEFENVIKPVTEYIQTFERQYLVMKPEHTYPVIRANIETCGEHENPTYETLQRLDKEMFKLVDCLEHLRCEGEEKYKQFQKTLVSAPRWVKTNLLKKLEECLILMDELILLNEQNKKKVEEALSRFQV